MKRSNMIFVLEKEWHEMAGSWAISPEKVFIYWFLLVEVQKFCTQHYNWNVPWGGGGVGGGGKFGPSHD